MRRGTTPAILISVAGILLTDIQRLIVTVKQKNTELNFEGAQLSIDGERNKITVYVTQEETLKLKSGSAQIQFRIRMMDGTVAASNIVSLSVDEILREGII